MRALEKREAANERRRETHTVETPDGPVPAVVWVSRTPTGTGPPARPGEPGGPPPGGPRDRGNRLRVRAGAGARHGAPRDPGPARRHALGAPAGLTRCCSTSPRKTSSAPPPPSARGPRPLHRIPETVAGLFDLGLRHHIRDAAMAWPTDDGFESVPDWKLDRLAIRVALFGAGEGGRRARRARGGARPARLALAGGGLRGHGLRRGAGRHRARPERRRRGRGARRGPTPPRSSPPIPRAPSGCCAWPARAGSGTPPSWPRASTPGTRVLPLRQLLDDGLDPRHRGARPVLPGGLAPDRPAARGAVARRPRRASSASPTPRP